MLPSGGNTRGVRERKRVALIYLHCFLRLSDLSLFPLSSLSASKAEWPTEEEEKEEEEEAEPKRRRREFHARCSRCRRYRRAAAAGARNLRCRTRRRGWQRNASNPLFSFGVRVRAGQQGWVKITEEGDSQTLWTVSLPLRLSSWISGKRFILVQAFSFTPELRRAKLQLSNLIRATLPSMHNQPWRTRLRYLRQ